MQPPEKSAFTEPPSKDDLFLNGLEKAINFHATNKNDPHNIGNAVMIALVETFNAYAKAMGSIRRAK